jgi:hypothetical protein
VQLCRQGLELVLIKVHNFVQLYTVRSDLVIPRLQAHDMVIVQSGARDNMLKAVENLRNNIIVRPWAHNKVIAQIFFQIWPHWVATLMFGCQGRIYTGAKVSRLSGRTLRNMSWSAGPCLHENWSLSQSPVHFIQIQHSLYSSSKKIQHSLGQTENYNWKFDTSWTSYTISCIQVLGLCYLLLLFEV